MQGVNFYKMALPEKPDDGVIQAWAEKIGKDMEDASGIEEKMEILMRLLKKWTF